METRVQFPYGENFFYDEENNDNNGIKLIKEFINNMYYTYGKKLNQKDN